MAMTRSWRGSNVRRLSRRARGGRPACGRPVPLAVVMSMGLMSRNAFPAAPRWARLSRGRHVAYVEPGRWGQDRVPLTAGRLGSWPPVAGPRRGPLGPCLPPAALVPFGSGQPLLGVGAGCPAGPVVRLGVVRRVHQTGDVPGITEHEGGRPAEQLRGPVTALPRCQMISDGSGDEGRQLDVLQL